MSEDIVFNEPGWEYSAGTKSGEMNNEGYCNVVRYCNIKYAMIEQIKNPPKGFEAIIKRHFYLKKEKILEECKQWIKLAKDKPAAYGQCQNSNWASQLQGQNAYYTKLQDIVKELEQVLYSIPPPSESDTTKKQAIKVKRGVMSKVGKKVRTKTDEEVIDVSYDTEVKEKKMNIEDSDVKDRWSRYIGAMGIDAVAR
mmetsp:Transcript_29748/g.27233  ORF Transcript_29748/g.27233 Transcript_29748/m.27233 type:complete len:197 (-) Transcript_29748:3171-3761(-)